MSDTEHLMEHLFEGETVESRIAEIEYKLAFIPQVPSEGDRYYVYYKEDVRFLLELLSLGGYDR